MDRFLIITNEDKDKDNIITEHISRYIKESGKKAVLANVRSLEESKEAYDSLDVECAIVLGGDGTIIRCATHLMNMNIPILGINLGTVGFLAEIEKNHTIDALNKLFADDYVVENRIMLRGELYKGNCHISSDDKYFYEGYALNDIVITRMGLSRIISMQIFVNDQLIDDYRGDGVIISTPTGSTAYNLSAGGPIIASKADVMVITPICPHSLSPRSVVVSAEDNIMIVIRESKKTQPDEAIATFDGQNVIELGTNDKIIIRKAEHVTKLIRLNNTSLFEVLRSKLNK
ncbi:NAD+ kinase [Herbinix hemicellulosilytica]|uniref:NAD kinase n=1 Tax=Herbinix hemicellulosilytica TaxID=1564487 RepID=A0A0H5SF98_HERHM|nr:NAD(+)/NADH kinase [Herbinix hemicellulosilytica]RBP57566.1 NAD+ kinase [Herbinix hemicellulosilytica]CRZ33690.1 putative inorganic polyphosphate/ATP-NAD kinase [Herbinix hemicellulosilytica]